MLKLLLFAFLPVFLFSGCMAKKQNALLSQEAVVEQSAPVDSQVWDFGKVNEGQVLKHDFIFKNETGKTLTINRVDTSCGCTASEVKKKVLKPQEDTVINVQFNSTNYSGPVQQYVYINTDDPANPITKFTIKADVQNTFGG